MNEKIRRDAAPFVTRVRVRDFRSIATCDVRLEPLTILAGFNASGKSNFLDALRFVRDALVLSPSRAVAERGSLDSLLHRNTSTGRAAPSFLIELHLAFSSVQGEATYEIQIGRDPDQERPLLVLTEKLRLISREAHAQYSIDAISGERIVRGDDLPGARLGPDELLLPVVGRLTPYDTVLRALTSMRFYDLDTNTLRELDDTRVRQAQLGERGEHLGQVLGLLADQHPEAKESVDGWMRWLVPSLLGVDRRMQGDFATIEARFWNGDPIVPFWEAVNAGTVHAGDPHVQVFQREQLSEGTVRGTGVLTALNQPDALAGGIPLLAIEEPELAIHPAKVSGLLAAMAEASHWTQVIATTQSSDLLTAEELQPSSLRLVEMAAGVSRIGELSRKTLQVLRENPSYLADYHRHGQLRSDEEEGA
ncbi:AAA family ATPase [Nonomuraea sp. NPDC049486]|uniref:AAA family ATPase n=1 Tax=Nonomuraea sp. NPDC049486 TaxID=3155773 RepID=UPI003413C863